MIVQLVERIQNREWDEKKLNELIAKYNKKPLFMKTNGIENLNDDMVQKLEGYEMITEDMEVDDIMRNIELEQENDVHSDEMMPDLVFEEESIPDIQPTRHPSKDKKEI